MPRAGRPPPDARRRAFLAAPRRRHPARRGARVRAAVPSPRARRHPRLPRRGRGGRPARPRPRRRRRIEDGHRRARHHAPPLHRRARAQSDAAVADEAGHLRARAAPGRAVRPRDHRGGRRGGVQLDRGARARAAAGAVVDRAGAADAPVGGSHADAVRRADLRDPPLPGPVDRPAHHDHRRDEPQPRRRGAVRRAGCWCWRRSPPSPG